MPKRSTGPDLSALHLGLEFVGGTLLFAGLGYWLDGRWGTSPWLAVTGGALGLAGGMWLLIKEAMKVNRDAAARFGKTKRNEPSAGGEPTDRKQDDRHTPAGPA